MSELAPCHQNDDDNIDAVNRRFELITNDFFKGPEGPYFVQKWTQKIDISELMKRQTRFASTREGSKPSIQNGRQLLLAVFDQVGIVEETNRIDEYRQARFSMITAENSDWSSEDSRLFKILDAIVRLNDATLPLVNDADEEYRTTYWQDYQHKTGQNNKRLEKLYEFTEPYEDSGLLESLRLIREAGFSQDVVIEADRIARIMLCKELDIEIVD